MTGGVEVALEIAVPDEPPPRRVEALGALPRPETEHQVVPPDHPNLQTTRRPDPRRPGLHGSRPMGDNTPQTPARTRPHPHPANRQPRAVRSPGTGRKRRRTAQVLADLPQSPMQPELNDVNRHRRPHPGATPLKRLTVRRDNRGFSRRVRLRGCTRPSTTRDGWTGRREKRRAGGGRGRRRETPVRSTGGKFPGLIRPSLDTLRASEKRDAPTHRTA